MSTWYSLASSPRITMNGSPSSVAGHSIVPWSIRASPGAPLLTPTSEVKAAVEIRMDKQNGRMAKPSAAVGGKSLATREKSGPGRRYRIRRSGGTAEAYASPTAFRMAAFRTRP